MKAQILTEDQIPEALSIARGVFDYCLRARITDLEMIHIFLQYTCLLYTSPSPRDRG